MALVVLGVLALGLDQATKYLAFSSLSVGESRPIVGSHLEIRLARNTGGAFGIFQNLPYNNVLLVITSSATLVLLSFIMRRYSQGRPAARIGFALIVAGALSNLLDRLFLGHVRDFIHLSFWPTFNLADVAICLGIGLFGFELLLEERSRSAVLVNPEPPAGSEPAVPPAPSIPADTKSVPPE